jgi:hypothetical protein
MGRLGKSLLFDDLEYPLMMYFLSVWMVRVSTASVCCPHGPCILLPKRLLKRSNGAKWSSLLIIEGCAVA